MAKGRRATQAGSVAVEPLEGRTLFASSVPEHLRLARRLVAEVIPENNLYDTPTSITWQGMNGATVSTNTSVCSTLVTALLKQSYGYTSADITRWTGESSPEAEDYYDAVMNASGFGRVMNIAQLKIGDLFIAKYLVPTSTATGHVAIASALPQLVSTTATERTYTMQVIDSSSSFHGNADTRNRIDPSTGEDDTGIGQGTMRMITDNNGLLIKYSWSTLGVSVIFDASERPAVFARVPGSQGGSDGTPPTAPPDPTQVVTPFNSKVIGGPVEDLNPTVHDLDELVSGVGAGPIETIELG